MFNRTTGKYEIKKTFKSTNHTIIGEGNTPEEARADLKAKLAPLAVSHPYLPGKTFYPAPLEPTGEYIRSPGYAAVQFEDGRTGYRYLEDRQIQVKARPDLAQAIREGKMPTTLKEQAIAEKIKASILATEK